MTENKIEKMKERIADVKHLETEKTEIKAVKLDPHKLAEVLVEMEERTTTKKMEGVLHPSIYKTGFLAAIKEVREAAEGKYRYGYESFLDFLSDLEKKYR